MRLSTPKKVRATLLAILRVLDKEMDWMLIPSRSETLRRLKYRPQVSFEQEYWREYYASSVREGVGKLLRSGKVETRETESGLEVRISDKGKTEIIKGRLETLGIEKPSRWDEKWRMVFFDVEELKKTKRDRLRKWLKRLGLVSMQRSVFVYPYPLDKEIKFLREVIGVPHGVKLVTAEAIENDGELRKMFDL